VELTPATRLVRALVLPLLAAATPVGAAAPAPAASTTAIAAADATLDGFLAQDDAARRALDPLDTLERGEPLSAAQFRLVFDPALTALQRARNAAARDALARIDLASLDPAHRISARAYAAVLDDEQVMLSPPVADMLALMPLNPVGGLQVDYPGLASAGGPTPLDSAADHAANLARDRALPAVFASAIARYREGMARGVTSPRPWWKP
jgi:uncharacterized protein (DUF885 family)